MKLCVDVAMFTFIEVGKRLIQAKSLVAHGEWGEWLKKNFELGQSEPLSKKACAEAIFNWYMENSND
ncbi:MAG: DUF3102 domain-containing protein [Selenomonadaceae bacterium]|nr:DUF3102 domain-containing protein [Selenomonadaceae bacterium]